jgi:hypothetical protein
MHGDTPQAKDAACSAGKIWAGVMLMWIGLACPLSCSVCVIVFACR